jgi:hypothetical protein
MPIQPDIGNVHVNQILTNISVGFMLAPGDFIADQAWPNVPVEKKSDSYYVFDRRFWMRNQVRERAPGTESQGTGFNVAPDAYLCKVFSLHTDISDIIRSNTDSPIQLDRENTSLLSQQALINREATWVAKAMVAGSWDTTSQAGVASASPSANQFTRWDFATGSDPVANINAWKRIIKFDRFTGKDANVLAIGQEVWDALKTNASIIDRIKYGQTAPGPAQVTRNVVAQLFELDEILVGRATQVTSAEGAATTTAATIVGKQGLLFYRPPSAGVMTASAGYTFSWKGYHGMSQMGHRIRKFRMENLESDRIEMTMAYDQKVISRDLGLYLSAMVS